ncbi:MAG: hypothetical protein FJ403_05465 [Verrucomicrobia bacterium]|nr:hypothetical protein [Verrucomicrobiota bacterium]
MNHLPVAHGPDARPKRVEAFHVHSFSAKCRRHLTNELNIECPDDLLRYLRQSGHLSHEEVPSFTTLAGGVSNRTVLVERGRGPAFVIKQALEKLRVEADWRSDPGRSHQEALGLQWLARLAPEGSITPLIFEDAKHHLAAMQAVPQPHENWKTRLLAGGLERDHIRQFGELLGTIHRRGRDQRVELSVVFDDRRYFETLRVEPYYRYTATRNPPAMKFYNDLIAQTAAIRETLVHGDCSPKNILVHNGILILLDHEVIHFGDPAFDLGFSLTHLLSKAHHLRAFRAQFLEAAQFYWQSYVQAVSGKDKNSDLEGRVVRHTLGCLLARIDGRSPLEYLTNEERDRQRRIVLSLITRPPGTVAELVERFGDQLQQSDHVHH